MCPECSVGSVLASVLALHGRQQQMRGMEVYKELVRKRVAMLLSTGTAARGLGESLAENILGILGYRICL